ncbi:MAG: TRAP transporter large permease [Thermincolia bacterium]
MELVIPGLVFLITLLLGVEIVFVFILTGFSYILFLDNWRLVFSVTQIFSNTFLTWELLAIPFFILAGEILHRAGLVQELFRFTKSLVGHWRGGLAYATQMATYLLSGVAGSANAEAAAITPLLCPLLEKEGFSRPRAAAILSAASLKGAIVPPSMLFIVYGAVTSTSIEQLFIGGFTVGALVMLSHLAVVIWYIRRDPAIKADVRASFKEMGSSFIKALPVLVIPVLIFVGLLGGWFTATESGAAASFLAFMAGWLIYRRLTWKDLLDAIISTSRISGGVMLIVAASGIVGYFVAYENIPSMLADFFNTYIQSPLLFLLIINVILLLLGIFLEPIPLILVLMPIIAPLAPQYGLDPVHFGLVVLLSSLLGMLTPPVGGVLFVVSAITGVKLEDLSREILPFVIASIFVLIIISLVPGSFLFWPTLLMD